MKLPYYPRWLNQLWAWAGGLFWLPCPICGRNFGGHEWGDTSLMLSWSRGEGVCPLCVEEAKKRNEEYMSTHPMDGGFVISNRELTEEETERLRQRFEGLYKGPKQRVKIIIK